MVEMGRAMANIQTVLVVDDSPEDRYAIRQAFVQHGSTNYVTLEASTGAEALDLCRTQQVDGILLNFLLPDGDGIAFLAALNAEEHLRAIPVAMLTGMGNELIAVQALKSGAQEFLIKGRSSPEELCLIVDGMIQRATLMRQMAAQQRALEQREAMFRTSVETMLDCFGIYSAIRDPDGQIIDFRVEYVNDAACVNNKLSREQQIGQRLCVLLPGHRECELFDAYCRLVETGEPVAKEVFIYDDVYGGQYLERVFDIRASKWGDGFVAAWRDITERRRIEQEHVQLLEREQVARQTAERSAAQLTQLHTLATALTATTSVEQVLNKIAELTTVVLDALSIGIGLVASDGLTIELTANSMPPNPEDVRQVSMMAPLPLADAVRRNQLIVFESNDDLVARYPLITAQVPGKLGAAGALIPLAVNQQVLGALAVGYAAPHAFDPTERAFLTTIGQLCAQALDQARRHEAEEVVHLQLLAQTGERERTTVALQASEARYHALSETYKQMVWHTSSTGAVVFTGSAWHELTGQPSEALQGWGWTDSLVAEDREQVMKVWLHALTEGTPYQSEFRVYARDGSIHTLESRAVPIRNDDGTIREWVGLNIDVTEQRHLARQATLVSDLMQRLALIIAALEHAQSSAEAVALIEHQVCLALDAKAAKLRRGTVVSHEPEPDRDPNDVGSADEAAHPFVLPSDEVPKGTQFVLPLCHNGMVIGVLELSFAMPPPMQEAEQVFLAAVTEISSHALRRLVW